ncbi:IS66 family insertion sequence element accessory protein TnpB [Sediminispirochaeta bajacaliforniensis]|uniref:IS66 family insertion sequence element accessory protein TnpB n=1 Tax=Sediminispirochaeta bajacaliforniensis TaxID=148 RepID=UPI0003655BD4|nr:IS66 family insertion sequence element accessory protein TnpB [Sediminispirochaeta bajacaliforniensis]
MIFDYSDYRYFIRPGKTDLRKGVNGLSLQIQNVMRNDPFSKSLFLFCNGQRKLMKIVYWDRNGFCLWQKRLEKNKFPWPETEEEAREIRLEELKMLLDGIDFFKAHKELQYSRV